MKQLNSQNQYKFIEPNISITYDTNKFRIGERFSNTFYETESYTFKYSKDTNAIIHITANIPLQEISHIQLDSVQKIKLEDMIKSEVENFQVISKDTSSKIINNFSCIGFTANNNYTKNYMTFIVAERYSNIDNTNLTFISNIKDLNQNYILFSEFLNGIKSYSEKEINEEERKIKNQVQINIEETKEKVEKFQYRPTTFIGLVKIVNPTNFIVKEVVIELNGIRQIFEPEKNGKIFISANDKIKGEIIKKGYLNVLNSFGKKVKVPFEFKYTNN